MTQQGSSTTGLTALAGVTFGSVMAFQLYRLVRAFAERQAHNAQSARTLAELDLRDSRLLRRMQKRGVVKVVTDGRYYLDLERWSEFKQARRRRVLIVLAAVALVIVAAIWFSRTE